MKTSTLNELKKELQTLQPVQILDLCMHLAKYKKENKELLTYLLFEAKDEQSYIKDVKGQVGEQFQSMNKSSIYLAKKTIRKVLRMVNKYIKYSGSKQTQVELLIFFCKELKNLGAPLKHSAALTNLYERQILNINKALGTLHEDLQYDYQEDLKDLHPMI